MQLCQKCSIRTSISQQIQTLPAIYFNKCNSSTCLLGHESIDDRTERISFFPPGKIFCPTSREVHQLVHAVHNQAIICPSCMPNNLDRVNMSFYLRVNGQHTVNRCECHERVHKFETMAYKKESILSGI